MNKIKIAVMAAAAALIATGCAMFQPAVPVSHYSWKLGSVTGSIDSPKDTTITGLQVELNTNGTAKVSIGSLSSVNNSNVIAAGDNGQALIVEKTGIAVVNGMNAGANLAGKVGAAIVKP